MIIYFLNVTLPFRILNISEKPAFLESTKEIASFTNPKIMQNIFKKHFRACHKYNSKNIEDFLAYKY